MTLGDADVELAEASRGGRVVRLLLLEAELFSHATLWSDGRVVWEVSYEGELDHVPLVHGDLPIGVSVPPDGADPRVCFGVAVTAVVELTGWRPGTSLGPAEAQP